MDVQTLLQTHILKLLDLQNLSEQQKTELLTHMGEVVQDRITDRIVESLSAEERAEFDALLDRNAAEQEVEAFLRAKIPDMESIVAEEVLLFKAQMVDDVATIRKVALQTLQQQQQQAQ